MNDASTRFPILDEEVLPGGGHTSFVLARGQLLRITDIEGGANVSLLLFSARDHSERLNLPDTLKCQHTVRLTAGHCLYSDMGGVLAASTADTCGWHDSLCGVLTAAEVAAKYGAGSYQDLRNGFHRNGADNLLVELGKWNLGPPDLLMTLNLFSKVGVDADGEFQFHPGNSAAGDYVELYAPMATLVVLTALPHPLDPAPAYAPRPVRLRRQRADASVADRCRNSRPENERGFQNTEKLYL